MTKGFHHQEDMEVDQINHTKEDVEMDSQEINSRHGNLFKTKNIRKQQR